MRSIGLLYSGADILGDSGNIRYRLGALSPKLKLHLSIIPKGLYSFRLNSPLEAGKTCVTNFKPVRTSRNSKSDQAVALGQIPWTVLRSIPCFMTEPLYLTEIFVA